VTVLPDQANQVHAREIHGLQTVTVTEEVF